MRITLAILSFLMPLTAVAEVSDKEPSVWINIAVSLFAILFALALIRFRWWLFPASLLVVAGFHFSILCEIYDPSIGPTIRNELGAFYYWQPQVFAFAGFGSAIAFATFVKRRRSIKSCIRRDRKERSEAI